MSNQKIKEIIIPPAHPVFEDTKSGARTIAFPIVFPDNSDGVLMVTRLKNQDFEPAKLIEKITVNYK